MHLEIDRLRVSYGSGALVAIDGISLTAKPGEIVTIVGPTGCGKSTLLKAVGGFLKADEGTLNLDGRPIVSPSVERAIIFQEYALFDWYTVLQNVEFGLAALGQSRSTRRVTVLDLVTKVGLADSVGSYPYQLSGGMRQRVAIARALAVGPSVLLCDEPFGSLDAQTRMSMQRLLLELWQLRHMTVLFSTHDIDEAVFVADRVVLLTSRPARVRKEFRVDLPRPRTFETRTDPAFTRIRNEVLAELARELEAEGWRL